jgi:hypothetical protein
VAYDQVGEQVAEFGEREGMGDDAGSGRWGGGPVLSGRRSTCRSKDLRRDYLRLGFGVQLGTVRMLGALGGTKASTDRDQISREWICGFPRPTWIVICDRRSGGR